MEEDSVATKHWRTIMVVVTNPFAREQLAATKAAAVARRCGARVVLFNTFMIPQPTPDAPLGSREQILASAIRQRRERLQAIAAGLHMPRGTELVVRWDSPLDEAIVRQVRRTKPDLLISESHRHVRLARIVLANTDWQLIRNCPCPVWFVRSKGLAKRPRVLVAVDPRHTRAKPAQLDDRLLQAAQSLEAQLDARVGIVHAYETYASAVPGVLRRPIRPRRPSPRTAEFIAATTDLVTQLAEKYGISADDCVVQQGPADKVIAAEAERRGADVLVMGAISRSLLTRPVIGNTAERVIDHVDCDVLIVKPADFEARAKRSPGRAHRRNERAATPAAGAAAAEHR
jgi:universal stress protein E